MNTPQMSQFLAQVSDAPADEFLIMVVDGASFHKSQDLVIPENIRLLPLPADSPELNPQEHVWDELREKQFPNRVFEDLDTVMKQLRQGLQRLATDSRGLRSLTNWPWIGSLILKAVYS
jgi:hypothetical protein